MAEKDAAFKLSKQQERVLELLGKGMNVNQIASRLRTTKGVVSAQVTRMRTKGVTLPIGPAITIDKEETKRRKSHIRSLNQQLAGKVEQVLSAQVLSAFEQAAKIDSRITVDKSTLPDLEHRLRSQPGAEHYLALGIHPFLQFDVVIKFVQLFGGRAAAHQAIEDVFSSLRGFLGIEADKNEGCEG